MKKVSKIIIICMLITVTLSTIFFLNKDQEIYKEDQPKEENKFLTLMVEKEAGSGKYEESNSSFPQEGYYFNEQLSKCENGSKMKYNEKDQTIDVYTTKSDKCYAYFDYDKLGSICRGQNLAECFTKNYKKDSSIIYHDGKADYAGEENYELEADDLSYRYTGANEKVNNFVCLDGVTAEGKCENDSNLYRIIGMFKNEENKYEVKLITATEGTITELGDKTTAVGGSYNKNTFYYWNNTNGTINNANSNMWQNSNLNKINLNTFYLNYITNKVNGLDTHITNHKWLTGGLPFVKTDNARQIYNQELGNEKIDVGSNKCYSDNDSQTAIQCSIEDITHIAKIGLMYLSDYGYAAYSNAWITALYNYDQEDITTNNWIFNGVYNWTISRRYGSNGTMACGFSSLGKSGCDMSIINGANSVRPCFYLTNDTKLKSGNGTRENPYRIFI